MISYLLFAVILLGNIYGINLIAYIVDSNIIAKNQREREGRQRQRLCLYKGYNFAEEQENQMRLYVAHTNEEKEEMNIQYASLKILSKEMDHIENKFMTQQV